MDLLLVYRHVRTKIITGSEELTMKKMAMKDKAMAHSHSNSVLLVPSEKGSIIWKFDNAVNIEIACNVPGHYDVGMIAKVTLD